MIIPYNVDVPMERVPFTNWALIGFTCLVSFVAFAAFNSGDGISPWMLHGAEPWGSDLGLIGAALTHADIMHLVGNMIFLFVFGNAVNAKLGHTLFIACYFAIGAFASLCSAIVSDLPGLGASGAIAGITGMFIIFFPRNNISVFYFFSWWWHGSIEVSAWIVIGLYFLKDLFFHLLELSTSFNGGIGYVAHLSGTLCGMAIAVALLMTQRILSTEDEENLIEVISSR